MTPQIKGGGGIIKEGLVPQWILFQNGFLTLCILTLFQ